MDKGKDGNIYFAGFYSEQEYDPAHPNYLNYFPEQRELVFEFFGQQGATALGNIIVLRFDSTLHNMRAIRAPKKTGSGF